MKARDGSEVRSLIRRFFATELGIVDVYSSRVEINPGVDGGATFRVYGGDAERFFSMGQTGSTSYLSASTTGVQNVNLVFRAANGGVETDRMGIDGASGKVRFGSAAYTAGSFVDIQGTTGGLCLPRLTTAERDAISSPADGNMIYNSTTAAFQARHSGAWVSLGAVSFVSGASGAAAPFDTRQALAADASAITTTALTDVLSLTGVGAGTWQVEVHLIYQSAATTTGLSTAINHSGTVTSFVSQSRFVSTGAAAATGVADQAAADNAGQMVEGKAERAKNTATSASAGVDTANSNMYLILNATLVVTVSGTLAFRVGTEVAASGITPKAGTHMILRKVA